MARNARPHESSTLYDMVVALVEPRATIADQLEVCEGLWQDPEHRPWLLSALMRKIGWTAGEVDEAAVRFLAEKIRQELRPRADEGGGVDLEVVVDYLPTIVLLVPQDAWSEPWTLWSRLLAAEREEFQIREPVRGETEPAAPSRDARERATLVAEVLLRGWSDESRAMLEARRGCPDYGWLSALRQVAGLNALLEAAHGVLVESNPLDDPRLIQRMRGMTLFDRRRVLTFQNAHTGAILWPESDPEIDEAEGMVRWRFACPLTQEMTVQLLAGGEPVGEARFSRTADGGIEVDRAKGICCLLPRFYRRPLRVKRAAKVSAEKTVPLTRMTRAAVTASPEGVVLTVEYRQEEAPI